MAAAAAGPPIWLPPYSILLWNVWHPTRALVAADAMETAANGRPALPSRALRSLCIARRVAAAATVAVPATATAPPETPASWAVPFAHPYPDRPAPAGGGGMNGGGVGGALQANGRHCCRLEHPLPVRGELSKRNGGWLQRRTSGKIIDSKHLDTSSRELVPLCVTISTSLTLPPAALRVPCHLPLPAPPLTLG